jgi:hypothetical protein
MGYTQKTEGKIMSVTLPLLISDVLLAKNPATEPCGICGEKGSEIYWTSPVSNWAHQKCVKKIQPAENALFQTIHELFKDDRSDRNHRNAHKYAIQAIREYCGKTIQEALEEKGIKELTILFNTIGVEAAKKYAFTQGSKL